MTAPPLDPLAAFEAERGRLFGIAYRMLGTVSGAEDVLQDAWLRWQAVDHAKVESPAAFLVRTVTRLCIDELGAARNRLTEYVGPWLPEPLVRELGADDDPAAFQERKDDLSIAFLLLLERLGPVERAVFLLRESFDYSYREIAEIVGKSEAACRQIESRARKRLEEGRRPVRPADPAEHDRLLTGFLHALREGDVQGMMQLVAADAVLLSDGGGKTHAARVPIAGAERIAKFLHGLASKAQGVWEIRPALLNGRLGALTFFNGRLANAVSIEAAEGRIQNVYIQVNPDKLPQL